MTLRNLAIVLSLLVAGPASAQVVNIDYDPKYPRDTIETFGWDDSSGDLIKQTSELLHDHILDSIEQYLEAGGIREVKSDPDVYVAYHTSVQDAVTLNTVNLGYFVPTSWYLGPYGAAVSFTGTGKAQHATEVKSYKSGTLVIDLWDAETKQLVWRGAAPDIAVSWNPKKIEKRLDKALSKMFAQWKEIRESAP
jgi:hypothetical protein